MRGESTPLVGLIARGMEATLDGMEREGESKGAWNIVRYLIRSGDSQPADEDMLHESEGPMEFQKYGTDDSIMRPFQD